MLLVLHEAALARRFLSACDPRSREWIHTEDQKTSYNRPRRAETTTMKASADQLSKTRIYLKQTTENHSELHYKLKDISQVWNYISLSQCSFNSIW